MESYSDMLNNLTDLILREKNRERKAELRKTHRELTDALQILVAKNINEDNKKYKVILASLEEANKSLQATLSNSKKVEDTLVTLTNVLGVIKEFS